MKLIDKMILIFSIILSIILIVATWTVPDLLTIARLLLSSEIITLIFLIIKELIANENKNT